MTLPTGTNEFSRLLSEQGNYVITIEGTDWYEYSGFMVPAYLPHCCPQITAEIASGVLKASGRPFARWDSKFGQVQESQWWYVLKRGAWAVEDVKDKKKRWMIRQGEKNFQVRALTPAEVLTECPKVAQAATSRYEGKAEVETAEILQRRITASVRVPGVLEYIGCFHEDTPVSFSENYIQDGAVWLANIRHDPAFLNKYSSYALTSGLLNHYLNDRKMEYVLDGSRSIHHRTEFQDHLIRVFGFTKEYAVLNVAYSGMFRKMVNMAYPFRSLVWLLHSRWSNTFLDKVAGVLRQEQIRRDCTRL